jgi:predicted GNAT family N-acyltransferase
MNDVTAKSPAECSATELEDFVSLVLAGGEVSPQGLADRAANAASLSFLRRNGCLVGVAGLKRPEASYRTRIASSAKFALSHEALPLELGWVFLMPSARGSKLSLPLCAPLVQAAGAAGIFATSRSSNAGMHATLRKLGFLRVGEEWLSKQVKENLCLFVRAAA